MKFSARTSLLLLSMAAFSQTWAQPQVNIVEYANGIYGKTSELAANGDGRIYAATQLGYIYIINPGGVVDTVPFLDINNKVTPTTLSNTGEQGLLGLAFSPNYATDSCFYVCYTNKTGHGNSVLARYKRSADPNVADTASAEIIFALAQPYTNHNGGCLKFGSDGYLYLALGDGGDVGDPGNRAQNMNMYFGKILRIDVSQPGAYTIPSTNPFFGVMNIKNEIWASGFRNPWKFSFDRLTHDMWIGDVGQDIWEEID
ncbi:MAG TPA: PQQ-dependent sugar dehydrogenase, partial [Bacteroidia bacterium]|nr:PQQ-dependent sugar dehydrogenase [Bacteroidia bacterium]